MADSSPTTSVPVDLRERLEVLFWQETTSYRTEDYLGDFKLNNRLPSSSVQGSGDPSSSTQCGYNPLTSSSLEQMKEHWREIICEWAYNLVDHFDLPRERVSVFTNLLDRYLQKYLAEHPEGVDKRYFQLLSLTCLYITIKLECHHQGFLSMDMMIHLSREKFSRSQMIAMEKEILKTLEWKLHPPTAYVFLRHLLLLLPPENQVHHDTIESARFFMELAVLDYQSVKQRPSRIALAALLNAMEETSTTKRATSAPFSAYVPPPERATDENHYIFLLSLVAPSEREELDECRVRLLELFDGLAATGDDTDDMEAVMHVVEAPLDNRMSSPVSVAQNSFH